MDKWRTRDWKKLLALQVFRPNHTRSLTTPPWQLVMPSSEQWNSFVKSQKCAAASSGHAKNYQPTSNYNDLATQCDSAWTMNLWDKDGSIPVEDFGPIEGVQCSHVLAVATVFAQKSDLITPHPCHHFITHVYTTYIYDYDSMALKSRTLQIVNQNLASWMSMNECLNSHNWNSHSLHCIALMNGVVSVSSSSSAKSRTSKFSFSLDTWSETTKQILHTTNVH